MEQLNELSQLSSIDKIKKILEFEYGYLLDRLTDCQNVEIKNIKAEELELTNKYYVKKLGKQNSIYNNFKLPRAICLTDGKSYQIKDGYHRVLNAKQIQLTEFPVLVIS